MKIDGTNPYITPDVQAQQRESTPQLEKAKTEEHQPARDRLEFSVTGKELQSIAQKAGETPEVRAQRVAEVKAQLDAGTYNIKAEEVAEAIITGSLIDTSA